ncbi:hypothetical protein LSAT2_000269 [Lamellibrachia satsuma]|nr:hypothetical protein LSAT2_000269 [Lamellibrachia satsuma]
MYLHDGTRSHGRQNRAACEMEGGDLGLGRGLKPGAISKEEPNLEFPPTDRDTISSEKSTVSQWEKTLEIQLNKARQEIECLQKDLLQCRDQLSSKVKVIQMLHSQSLASQTEDKNVISKLKRLNRSLQEEVNRLVFELEHKDSSVTTSEQTWTERFNSMATENVTLHDVLQDKTEEMRQLHLSNIALQRERVELLALMEVKERQRYETLSSPTSVDDYNTFSSFELAVLGACQCRLQNAAPCSCAQTAANLKRDIRRLKDSVEMHKKHHQEALVTVDAYRVAFEEQLSRNKTFAKKMADVAIATTPVATKSLSMEERLDKAKAVLKFLIQTMTGDFPQQRPSTFPVGTQVWSCAGFRREGPRAATADEQLVGKTHEELTQILVEMMSERSEALAHQRLAARLLAQHTRELEEKLSQITQQQSSTTDSAEGSKQDLQKSPTATDVPRRSSDEGSLVESGSGL